jgi:hypothetical protein
MSQAEPEEIFIGPMSPLRKLFLKNVKVLGSLRTTAAIRDTCWSWSQALYRQLLAARPMYLCLERHILKSRSIRSEYVRTEAKQAVLMARIASELLTAT